MNEITHLFETLLSFTETLVLSDNIWVQLRNSFQWQGFRLTIWPLSLSSMANFVNDLTVHPSLHFNIWKFEKNNFFNRVKAWEDWATMPYPSTMFLPGQCNSSMAFVFVFDSFLYVSFALWRNIKNSQGYSQNVFYFVCAFLWSVSSSLIKVSKVTIV